jgi:transcriptional regulator with XRE-family HTH domain
MRRHSKDTFMSHQRTLPPDEVSSPNPLPTGADHPGEEGVPSSTPGSAASAAATHAAWLRENILRLVSERCVSLARLAKMSGMPNANRLYNFLGGHSISLSMATLQQLSQALGVTMDELLRPPPRHTADGTGGSTAFGSPAEPPKADRAIRASDAWQAFDSLSASLEAVRLVLVAAAAAAAKASKASKVMARFD